MTIEAGKNLPELKAQIAEMLNKTDLDVDAPLGELGVDSMNIVEVILIVEQLYPEVTDPDALTFDETTSLREMDEQLVEYSEELT
jgi:acyl carrier protein